MGVYTVPAQEFVHNGQTYHISSFQFTDEIITGKNKNNPSIILSWRPEGSRCFLINAGGYAAPVCVSNNGKGIYAIGGNDNTTVTTNRSFTHEGQTAYYHNQFGAGFGLASDVSPALAQASGGDLGIYAWLVAHGGYIGYGVTYDLDNCTGDAENPTNIAPDAVTTIAHFTPDSAADIEYAFNSGSCWIDGDGFPSGNPIAFVWQPETGSLRIGVITSDIVIHVHASADPYAEGGGGEGSLPGDEIIGMPSEPALSPIDAGLFSLYSPTAAQMRNLADFLWTDFGGTGTTVEQVLEEVVEALKRSVSNPLNSMLGLSIIASRGLSKGSDSSVRVGFWNTGVSMTTITKQYFTVDCGSLSFSPVCGNTFLDYAPYSKFMIFLPYVGMRLLDANDVVGHTISIRYRGDCVSGALTCYVIRDGSVIQEHTGNCALNIPLTADSWAQSISAVGQIISGTVAGGAIGGGAAAAAGAVRGAASLATNPSAFSSQVAHTGAVSGAAGHLGSQKPFILREAVRFHSTNGFSSIIGYPSYYYRKLGDCHGYTQCLEVHLNHTPCTGVELQEIEELLKKGVII